MEKQFKLGTTKNYSMFKNAKNRNIDTKRINVQKKSIQKIGLQQPIILNEQYQVVDGQHRLEALKQLRLPVHYVISRNWSVDEDTAVMNNTQVKWSTQNWAEFRASQGNETAKSALDFAANYFRLTDGKMTINTALEMIADESVKSISSAFKNNTYKYNMVSGQEIFQILNIISEYPSAMRNAYNQKFVRSIKYLVNDLRYINKKAIVRMAKTNYISNYNNEIDTYKYIKKIYNQSLKK